MGPCRSLLDWRAGSSIAWFSSSQILEHSSTFQLIYILSTTLLLWMLQHFGLSNVTSSLDWDLWKQITQYKDQLKAMENFTEEHILLVQRLVDITIRFSSHWGYMQSILLDSCCNFFLWRDGFGIFSDRRSPRFACGWSKYHGVTRFEFLPLLSLQ